MIESNKNIKSKLQELSGIKSNKSSNVFDTPVSNIEFKKVTKNYSLRIIGLENELKSQKKDLEKQFNIIEQLFSLNKDFKNQLEKMIDENISLKDENKQIKNDLLENFNILNKTKDEFIATKRTFKWFISIFLMVFIGWCIETFYRFGEVKTDYINQTVENKKELEKQIELLKKEQEDLKENNQKLKENIKNEIEKDIYQTMLGGNNTFLQNNNLILEKNGK